MNAAVAALRPRPVPHPDPGRPPEAGSAQAFADDETSCLFATVGLFQGVDVPGAALSLVTIDRIPFPRPTTRC